MVHPGTLFIGDSGAFLCIPMKIGVKSEHCHKDIFFSSCAVRCSWGGAGCRRDVPPNSARKSGHS
jgi:hypothetical protein